MYKRQAKGYSLVYELVAELPIVQVSLGIGGICVVVGLVVFIFEKKLASLVELREGETLVED